jgi:4-hydroxybenzoate polyprenyltransferase
MATPGLCALLWLGALPPAKTVILGLITTFAGYTAVYALNDMVDYPVDKRKFQQGGFEDCENYLDALIARHPVAQGLLSFREGLFWVAAWMFPAIVGAYLLNPVCVLIFLCGCLLEVVYCLLWRRSAFRGLISGAVKTTGGIAAVFAVDPNPSVMFLLMLFLWLFFWEIGEQNIPNDWIEMEEDRRLGARTIPVRFGRQWAGAIILWSLSLAVVMNVALFRFTSVGFELYYVAACVLAGIYLLIIPAYRLYKTKSRRHALALFKKASHVPLVLLVVITIKALF